MHSTARMNGDDGGTMVDMKGMNRILHFTDDTVTVEAGVTHMDLAKALKDRGLQPYVTTEIGNVTLGAMATAATKDSSFPGGFGQVSSYVTAVRLVTPDGKLREITERDNPKEMQIIRSSYGGAQTAQDFPFLARLYLKGKLKLDELITRRISLEQINEGFDDLRMGRAIRTVIVFDGPGDDTRNW